MSKAALLALRGKVQWAAFRAACAFALLASTVACTTPRTVFKTEYVTVEKAVPILCKPRPVAQPVYPFDLLPANSDIFEATKALVADRLVRMGEIFELRAANTGVDCPAVTAK
jgi:hypothetical protein